MIKLEVKNLIAGYGSVTIVDNCNFYLNEGEIVSILGPNGAGKSTAMKAMVGILDQSKGSIRLSGKEISHLKTQNRIELGISFVPQTNNIFAELTVLENIEIGGFLNKNQGKNKIDEMFDLFPIIKEKRNQLAGELSGGQRQQVAIARALMTNPSVLMLDEPTAGVSPIVMKEIFEHILRIKSKNISILMVEQNASQALKISDRGYVLVSGKNAFHGTGNELLNNPEIRKTFLGG